jgi:tetratricopeptide (TPR) repeat protein
MPSRWTPSRSSARRTAWALAIVLCGPTGALSPHRPAALAAETEATNRAREHYKNGEKAFKAGNFEEALHEWEAGYQLSARPLFLLNMGHAERRRGQLGNARTLYKRFLLMEPESKLRGEIEGVLREIDSTLAAEAGAAGKSESAAPSAGGAQAPAPAPVPITAEDAPPGPSSSGLPGPAALAAQNAAQTPDSQASSLHTSAAPPPARPIWRRWWFWAGAGTVVALGVVSGVLLLRGDSYTKTGSIGTLGGPP